jgi:hypothetical protein
MDKIIDHVALMCSPENRDEVADLLEKAGFPRGYLGVARDEGLEGQMMVISTGGFIELSAEVSAGAHRASAFTRETPRIAAVAYMTTDGAADLAHMHETAGGEGSFACCGGWWPRSDDPGVNNAKDLRAWGYYVGIMPPGPPFFTDTGIYFHLQERRLFPPPYLDKAAGAPVLRRVTVRGPDAEMWRRRHTELFRLPQRGDAVYAGDTELVFEQVDGDESEIIATFAVPNPSVKIPLAGGAFEFVPMNGGAT